MRQNPSSPGSVLSEEMRQFMPQSAIDFGRTELLQQRVETNAHASKFGPANSRAHTLIPLYAQPSADLRGADALQ
jgi:hypothetical protein